MPQPEAAEQFSSYLFLGPEKGLKDEAIASIKASLEALHGGCDVSKFYAFDDYEEEMFAQLNNMDFFSSYKLVILDAAHEIKTADKVKAICNYLQSPSETATLILTSEEKFINRGIMDSFPTKAVKVFYELFESEKGQWLKNFFRKGGFSIDTDACDAILEKVENNIQDMSATCSQMMVYLGTIEGKTSVTYDDVEDFLAHTREESEFSLFGYMAHRKLESSLECFQTLIRTNDMASVTSVVPGRLAAYFRRALTVSINMSNGMGVDLSRQGDGRAFSNKLYDSERPITMPKDKETYRSCVRNYTQQDLEAIIALLAQCDIEIRKTGNGMQALVMEHCISDIVVHKGRRVRILPFAEMF